MPKAPGWSRAHFPGSEAVQSGTTPISVTVPAAASGGPIVDGDVLCLILTHKDAAGWATLLSGWTILDQQVTGTFRTEWWWKRAQSEPVSYTITIPGSTASKALLSAYRGGLVGTAVSIDGEGRGFRNDGDFFPATTTDLTVMFWLRFDVAQTTQWRDLWTFLPRNDWSQSSWVIGCTENAAAPTPQDPVVEFYVWDGMGTDRFIDTPPWTIGEWHHVCYVKEGSTHRAYLDGTLLGTETLSLPAVTDWADIGDSLLGALADHQGEWSVACFRQWTTALTGVQVAAERLAPTAIIRASLFREVSLLSVDGTDTSGQAHPFTVISGGAMSVTDGPPLAYDVVLDHRSQVGGQWVFRTVNRVILDTGLPSVPAGSLLIAVLTHPTQIFPTYLDLTAESVVPGSPYLFHDRNTCHIQTERHLTTSAGTLRYFDWMQTTTAESGGIAVNYLTWPASDPGIVMLAAFRPDTTTETAGSRYYLTYDHPAMPVEGFRQGTWDAWWGGPRGYDPLYGPEVLQVSQEKWAGGRSSLATITRNAEVPGTSTPIAVRLLLQTWVTPPLVEQDLGGTFSLTLGSAFQTSDATPFPWTPDHDVRWAVHLFITQGDSLTTRSVVLDNWVDATAWGTKQVSGGGAVHYVSDQYRSLSSPVAISGHVEEGDRLGIELGVELTPLAAYPAQRQPPENWVQIRLGRGVSTGSDDPAPVSDDEYGALVPLKDAAGGELQLVFNRFAGFLAFSQTIQERVVVGGTIPDHTSCATAKLISALPFSDTALDTTRVPASMRQLWYRWIAPSTRRVILSTYGSTIPLRLENRSVCPVVNHQDAPDFTVLAYDDPLPVVQVFDTVAGELYYFQFRTVAGNQMSPRSGGMVTVQLQEEIPLANNDVIVATGGQLLRYTEHGAFAAVRPACGVVSGLAIDYSQVTLIDQFGETPGQPHTAERLLVALFVSDVIQIFTLATLNLGASELDYFLDNVRYTGSSRNPSAIATDTVQATSTVYVGYFSEDAFRMTADSAASYLDRPDSLGQSAIQTFDVTQADNQPGAPFPVATRWVAAVESGGTNYLELNPAGTELFYTSGGWYRPIGGQTIFRWDVVNGVQLPAFATVPVGPGPNPGLKGLFPLPETPTTPTGGVLVCNGGEVRLLDQTGATVRTFVPAETALALSFTDVELQADGKAFWALEEATNTLFKWDLATGAQLRTVPIRLAPGSCTSLVIYRATAYPPVNGNGGNGGTVVCVVPSFMGPGAEDACVGPIASFVE